MTSHIVTGELEICLSLFSQKCEILQDLSPNGWELLMSTQVNQSLGQLGPSCSPFAPFHPHWLGLRLICSEAAAKCTWWYPKLS